MTNPDNKTTTFAYDNMDRQTSISQPGVDENGTAVTITTSKTYNWEGKPLIVTDANLNKTENEYNLRGFLVKITDEKLNVAAFYYDRAGRKTAEVSPKNYSASKTLTQMNRSEFAYDKMNRLKTKTEIYQDPITSLWKTVVTKAFKYDEKGNVIKELDARGYQNGTGTTADEKINTGYGTEYTYNLANLAETMTDAVSKERGLSYT